MPEHKPIIGAPLFAGAIAAISLLALLVVDHGPWSKPKILPAQMVEYSSTAAAARAAGALVTATRPKDPLDPASPGPKPVQPAVPDQNSP